MLGCLRCGKVRRGWLVERPVLGSVRGANVYILQPTCPPVNDHLVELLLLVSAARRASAATVTAVVPY